MDTLSFLSFIDTKVSGAVGSFCISMDIVSPDNSATLSLENISIIMGSGRVDAFEASTQISPASYSRDSECYFKFTSNNSIYQESEIQQLSNTLLKLSFAEWEIILLENLNMHLKDIGFVSYK